MTVFDHIDPAVIRQAATNGADVYPYAEYRPIPEATTQPPIRPWLFMLHTMAGPRTTTPDQLWAFVNRGDITGESHLILGYDTMIQAVPFTVRADNNYHANSWFVNGERVGAISVETQDNGNNTDPGIANAPWNRYQLEHLAGTAAFLALRYGIPLQRCATWDDQGVDGHRAYPEWSKYVGKTCPGQTRWEQIPLVLAWATEIAGTPPVGDDDMIPLVIPERVYDSRQNDDPFTAGETRTINVGSTQAFLHLTLVTEVPGYLSVSGSDTRSGASLVNADGDGVASDGAPISLPDGQVRVFSKSGGHVIVDVYARG